MTFRRNIKNGIDDILTFLESGLTLLEFESNSDS